MRRYRCQDDDAMFDVTLKKKKKKTKKLVALDDDDLDASSTTDGMPVVHFLLHIVPVPLFPVPLYLRRFRSIILAHVSTSISFFHDSPRCDPVGWC